MTAAAADPPSASFGEAKPRPPTPIAMATTASTSRLVMHSSESRSPAISRTKSPTARAGWTTVRGARPSAAAWSTQPRITHAVPISQRLRDTRFLSRESFSDSESGTSRASSDWSRTPTL